MSEVDLTQVSLGALRSEIQRREREEAERKERERKERGKILRAIGDSLIALVPKHSFSTCSDESVSNAQRGCVRCVLLDANEYDLWDEIDVTLQARAVSS